MSIDAIEQRYETTRRLGGFSLSMVAERFYKNCPWQVSAQVFDGQETIADINVVGNAADPADAFAKAESQARQFITERTHPAVLS